MRAAAIFLAVQLMAAPALAQQADISHYDITVRPDFTSGRLHVTTVVTFSKVDAAGAYTFGLNPRFDSIDVALANHSVTYRREKRSLIVQLPKGDRVEVTIRASGVLGRSEDEDRSIIGAGDLFLLWSDLWYPAAFGDWASARFKVVLPARFKVIAPGRSIGRSTSHGLTTHIFDAPTPMATYSVFADTSWITFERTVKGMPITLQLHPRVARYADTLFTSSADVLRFFTALHGYFPYQTFSFITQDSMFARRAYSGFIGYKPAWLEKEMARTGYDAHETSLLWWGGITRGSGRGAWQWTEGFGDYVEVLYAEARHLPLPANFERFRSQYLALADSQDVPIHELNGSTAQVIVHGKYPWLMHLLRYRIGDQAFRRGIRNLFERYRFRSYSLDEFVRAFSDAAGASLEWWRNEWLNRPGVPTLEYSYSYAEGAIKGEVRQTGNVYHLPIELGIFVKQAATVHTLQLNAAVDSFRLPAASAPDSVVLDPRKWVLARITRK